MLAEVRKRLADPHASLDAICGLLDPDAAAADAPAAAHRAAKRVAGRHVRWQRVNDYECVVRGREFANAAELDAAWAERSITLQDMFWVRNRQADALGKRTQINPHWEALYYLSDEQHYVRVQKCHLRHAYNAAGRTDKALAWTMVQDLPYWIERHAYSVLKIK